MKIFTAILCIIGLLICLGAVGTMDRDEETHTETLTLGEFILIASAGLVMFILGFALNRIYDTSD